MTATGVLQKVVLWGAFHNVRQWKGQIPTCASLGGFNTKGIYFLLEFAFFSAPSVSPRLLAPPAAVTFI